MENCTTTDYNFNIQTFPQATFYKAYNFVFYPLLYRWCLRSQCLQTWLQWTTQLALSTARWQQLRRRPLRLAPPTSCNPAPSLCWYLEPSWPCWLITAAEPHLYTMISLHLPLESCWEMNIKVLVLFQHFHKTPLKEKHPSGLHLLCLKENCLYWRDESEHCFSYSEIVCSSVLYPLIQIDFYQNQNVYWEKNFYWFLF